MPQARPVYCIHTVLNCGMLYRSHAALDCGVLNRGVLDRTGSYCVVSTPSIALPPQGEVSAASLEELPWLEGTLQPHQVSGLNRMLRAIKG